ncbi:radical SAM protein [Candidatus Woesearchaeota archaeon]|nr:radical SAM protein [Candidatus Woesearchaeota archaeon]
MKIAIIKAPIKDAQIKHYIREYYPLDMAYLGTYLKENKIEVILIDAVIEDLTINDVIERLKNEKVSIAGFTTSLDMFTSATAMMNDVRDAINAVKQQLNIPTFAYGFHAAALPEQTLQEIKGLDFVIMAEPELTLLEFAQKDLISYKGFNADDEQLQNIQGLAFRKEGKFFKTIPRQMIQNLDILPIPDRELLPMKKYQSRPISPPEGQIIFGRGCPFQCIFCSPHVLYGYKHRTRSPENMIKEIKMLQEKYGVKNFGIMDPTLTISKDAVMKLCQGFIDAKLDITWGCYARINIVDEELLKKMYDAGCRWVDYGIESGDDEILKRLKKATTVKQGIEKVELTKKVGINPRVNFLIGFPFETKESIQKTVDLARSLIKEESCITVVQPYPGTELYRMCDKEGLLKTKDWSQYVTLAKLKPKIIIKLPEETEKAAVEGLEQIYGVYIKKILSSGNIKLIAAKLKQTRLRDYPLMTKKLLKELVR